MTKGIIKAESMLEHAKLDMSEWSLDDVYLAESCMFMHYGLEACLRHVADISGVIEITGHDLHLHLNNVSVQLQQYSWYSELLDTVKYTRDWHTGFMYLVNFTETSDNVKKAMILLSKMIMDLRDFTPKESSEVTPVIRIQTILDRNNTGLKCEEVAPLLPSSYLTETNISLKALNETIMFAVRVIKDKS